MSVVEVYSTFMGRGPTREFVLHVPGCNAPAHLAMLGALERLAGLKVWRGKGEREYPWQVEYRRNDGALLLASERGILYCYDPCGCFTDVDRITIVQYFTDKGEGPLSYRHDFRPGTPALSVLPNSRGTFARLVGGRYSIDERGII